MAIVDSRLTAAMIGAAIGDAMGLPVQGETPATLAQNPVTAMRGYGHFGLPAGYYSDETAMNLATMAALTHGFDPRRILNEYRRWAETFEYAAYTGPSLTSGRACNAPSPANPLVPPSMSPPVWYVCYPWLITYSPGLAKTSSPSRWR